MLDSQGQPIAIGCVNVGTYPRIGLYKFDAQGNAIFSNAGLVVSAPTEVAVGPSDEIVVFGRDDWYFGGSLFVGTITRYDAGGALSWHQSLASDGYATLCCGTYWGDHIEDGAIDSQGRIYAMVNGSFGSEWFHDGWTGFRLACYSPGGSQLYSVVADSPLATQGVQLTVDAAQQVYVAGYEGESLGVADRVLSVWSYSPTGLPLWNHKEPLGNGISAGTALDVTASGDLFVTGHRYGTSPSGLDLLFDNQGNVLWQRETLNEDPGPFITEVVRDDVLGDVQGRVMVARNTGETTTLVQYVPGSGVGTRYCDPAQINSTGQAGQLWAIGQTLAGEENLNLCLAQLPPGHLSMFLASPTQGFVPSVGGSQGDLCLGGAIGRFNRIDQVRIVPANGAWTKRVDFHDIPTPTAPVSILAGQTWCFQNWYRDHIPASTSNLTNAVEIQFQ
ncbi:MAG: hypothetical protein R3F33_06760 [Planctomycetota bacterium]